MTSVHCPESCWMSSSGVRTTRPGTDPAHRQPGARLLDIQMLSFVLCDLIPMLRTWLHNVTSAVSSLVVVPGLATHWGS